MIVTKLKGFCIGQNSNNTTYILLPYGLSSQKEENLKYLSLVNYTILKYLGWSVLRSVTYFAMHYQKKMEMCMDRGMDKYDKASIIQKC